MTNDMLDESDLNRRWPELLAQLVAVNYQYNRKRMRMGHEDALDDAERRIALLADHLGGQPVYLPKGDKYHRAVRDSRIWHEFNGRNHRELAQRWHLTTHQIYAIIRQQRELHSRQEHLFEQ